MAIQTPPGAPCTPDLAIDAGVIEDARRRQRRERRIGGVLIAAAAVAAALVAGAAGGGGGSGAGAHAHGQPSGPRPGGGPTHAPASKLFTGAPITQLRGYGVTTDACPLAPPNRYLPGRSGCVTVRRADVNGDGRPDLIIVYSRLSHRHPSGFPAASPLRDEFVADAAFLKVVLAGGTTVSTRITQTRAAAIDAIAHVNDDPGSEIFLEVARISSGADGVAYGFHDGGLIAAGITLSFGGDSATKADFDCLPGNPPRLIQRTFELVGPTIYGWWQETNLVYAWHGPKLVPISKSTFRRHGAVRISNLGIGHGCASGIA